MAIDLSKKPPHSTRVLIVGAGLGGLAVAAALNRRGYQLTIIESRPPADERYGAGVLLPGNAFRALAAMVPAEALLPLIRPVSYLEFAAPDGSLLFRVDCARPDWPCVSTTRHSTLRSLLLRNCGVEVRHDMTIDRIVPSNMPQVQFSDGSETSFDLVIGADGVHSSIREFLFPGSAAVQIGGFQGFRFITRCPPGLHHPQQIVGNGRSLLLYPLPHGELYVGAGPIAAECFKRKDDHLEIVRETYAQFGGFVPQVLHSIDRDTDLIPTRYWNVEQPVWTHNHYVLIGDAAHASAPTLAQGGAMAFEDALVLAEELDTAASIHAALVSFEVRRKPRVERVRKESLARMDANRLLNPHELAIRDSIAKRIGAQQITQQWNTLVHEPI